MRCHADGQGLPECRESVLNCKALWVRALADCYEVASVLGKTLRGIPNLFTSKLPSQIREAVLREEACCGEAPCKGSAGTSCKQMLHCQQLTVGAGGGGLVGGAAGAGGRGGPFSKVGGASATTAASPSSSQDDTTSSPGAVTVVVSPSGLRTLSERALKTSLTL